MTDLVKETCDALAGGMANMIDNLILAELSRHLGRTVTVDEAKTLADRLHRIVYRKNCLDGVEVYEFDGMPFMELCPIETRLDDGKLIAERKYRSIK